MLEKNLTRWKTNQQQRMWICVLKVFVFIYLLQSDTTKLGTIEKKNLAFKT